MLEFSRRLLKRFHTVCRKAGLARSGPDVAVETDGAHLSLRVVAAELVIELCVPCPAPTACCLMPFAVVAAAASSRDEPLRIEPGADGAIAAWLDRGLPQRRPCGAGPVTPSPERPASTAANSSALLAAVHEASLSTDDGSHRFALSRVQLQALGRVVGTDGRQLYVHEGFAFPWPDDALVARTTVFGAAEFDGVPGVTVGRTEQHVVLTAGDWTVWLAVDPSGRFPKTNDVIPRAEQAHGTIVFDPEDAALLLNALPRLPAGADDEHAGVVLDVGPSICVDAAGATGTTRLRLPRSRREGVDLRLAVDRRYLARTLQLGFTRLHYFGGQSPVLADDLHRRFVWAVLDGPPADLPAVIETLEPPAARASSSRRAVVAPTDAVAPVLASAYARQSRASRSIALANAASKPQGNETTSRPLRKRGRPPRTRRCWNGCGRFAAYCRRRSAKRRKRSVRFDDRVVASERSVPRWRPCAVSRTSTAEAGSSANNGESKFTFTPQAFGGVPCRGCSTC